MREGRGGVQNEKLGVSSAGNVVSEENVTIVHGEKRKDELCQQLLLFLLLQLERHGVVKHLKEGEGVIYNTKPAIK